MARKIRFRYTGLVMFMSRVISILTGLAFVTMVTRNVSLTEYGIWQYMVLLVSYFVFPNRTINYWVTRFVARRFKVAKIGLLMNLIFSLIGFVVLFAISPFVAKLVNTDPLLFMVGSLIIPSMYLVAGCEAIAKGSSPHINAYGFLTFEVTKVILGAITILHMQIGIYGALVSVLIAYIAQASFLLTNLRNYIREAHVDWNTASKWLRTGWIPLYSDLPPILVSLDAMIVTMLTSSTEPIGLWKVGTTITQVVGFSSLLTYALYPKLLAGGSEEDVETALKLVLTFAIPSAIGALLLAEPLLWILGYQYRPAANILRMSILSVLLASIGDIWNSIIIGTEKVDTKQLSFKRLLKSRLFLLPTLNYAKVFVYLPLVCIVTTTIISTHTEPVYLNVPFACNVMSLLTLIPIVTYTYRLAKGILPFKFPLKSLAKYVLASMVLFIIIIPFYPRGFAGTITLITISALAYFLILCAIDKDTRELVSQVISTFKMRYRAQP